MTPQRPVVERSMRWTPRSLGKNSGKLSVVEKVGVFHEFVY